LRVESEPVRYAVGEFLRLERERTAFLAETTKRLGRSSQGPVPGSGGRDCRRCSG
jgi:hypothetical protein